MFLYFPPECIGMDRIDITKEEFADENSDYVHKITGIAMTRVEKILAYKLNEVIDALNRLPKI